MMLIIGFGISCITVITAGIIFFCGYMFALKDMCNDFEGSVCKKCKHRKKEGDEE